MKTLTILLILLAATLAGAQGKYQTFAISPNADGAPVVTAINDSGQVLGYSGKTGEAYVLSPGDVWTRNIVKTNGSFNSPAQIGITMNNAATIVGQLSPSNQAFYKLWGEPAQEITLRSETSANAINTAGYVAGTTYYFSSKKNQQEVYLWGPGNACCVHVAFPHDRGETRKLDYNAEYVTGLNNLNQIVGSWVDHSTPWSGFFYDGTSKKLNTSFNMPGAVTTYPTAINDNQEVVGNWYDSNGVEHGFYWNPTAGFSDIDVTGDIEMGLIGINNSSVILGWWQDDNTPTKMHYVTIVNGKPTASINVPKSQAGSTVATAINNVGQIVGQYQTKAGVYRGFVYTPSK
jgi:probable HAF family extracellular repeat protein